MMQVNKTTNALLILIFLALIAHLFMPLVRIQQAEAADEEAVRPFTVVADVAQVEGLDMAAGQIAGALVQIAQSNREIARALMEQVHSSDRLAISLEKMVGRDEYDEEGE